MWEQVPWILLSFVTLVIGFLVGFVTANYFFKKKFQEFQKQVEMMEKEKLRSMSSAFGHKLSEEQLNKMTRDAESFKKKTKPKKLKK